MKCLADILTIMIATRKISTARAPRKNLAEDILELRGGLTCRNEIVLHQARRQSMNRGPKKPLQGEIRLRPTGVLMAQVEVNLGLTFLSLEIDVVFIETLFSKLSA